MADHDTRLAADRARCRLRSVHPSLSRPCRRSSVAAGARESQFTRKIPGYDRRCRVEPPLSTPFQVRVFLVSLVIQPRSAGPTLVRALPCVSLPARSPPGRAQPTRKNLGSRLSTAARGERRTHRWREGFEPSIPRDRTNLSMSPSGWFPPTEASGAKENRHTKRRALPPRNRWFESCSLQRRVCEPPVSSARARRSRAPALTSDCRAAA